MGGVSRDSSEVSGSGVDLTLPNNPNTINNFEHYSALSSAPLHSIQWSFALMDSRGGPTNGQGKPQSREAKINTHTHREAWRLGVTGVSSSGQLRAPLERAYSQPTYNSRPHAACICQLNMARQCDKAACH